MPSPVLMCTDGSELSIAALRAGLALLGSDREFVVVTVRDEPDATLVTGTGLAGGVMTAGEYERLAAAAAEEAADVVTTTAQALGIEGAATRVLEGAPGPAICDLAAELAASAVVIGSRGRGGLRRAVLGSVSDHVVRNAPCPVIVTGPHGA